MKTLVVSNRMPFMPGRDFSGGAQRFSMFMRVLARLSNRIDLLHLVPNYLLGEIPDAQILARAQSERWGTEVHVDVVPTADAPQTRWSQYGAGIFSLHGHPQFQPLSGRDQVIAVRRHLEANPDLVFCHHLASMCPIMRGNLKHPRLFLDFDDIDHRVFLRATIRPPHWPGKICHFAQIPAIMLGERKATALARSAFVCSEIDRRYLAKWRIARNVTVIPNAARLPQQALPLAADPTLLFLGVYNYAPNAEAAERLIGQIWPLVRQRCPNARLLIAGPLPEALPSFQRRPPGVDYLGFVPDLEALYRQSRVVCCPIQVGGGTRVKLVEAAAYGKPMVSTRIGAEGLDLRPGTDLIIADDDAEFATNCAALLQDDALCERLGRSARDRVQSLYEVSAVEQRLRETIEATAR